LDEIVVEAERIIDGHLIPRPVYILARVPVSAGASAHAALEGVIVALVQTVNIAGPSAVAICAVIGGNARTPGIGRLTVEHKSACGRPLGAANCNGSDPFDRCGFFH
jgi:hypothetical protein